MKLFDDNISTNKINSVSESSERIKSASTKVNKVQNKRSKIKPVKQDFSEVEIRQKLASNVELSNTAKQAKIQKNSTKLGDGFLNSDMSQNNLVKAEPQIAVQEKDNEESSSEKSYIMKSDVTLNNPDDPSTKEKLKTVISKGAFNFNPKERDVLERILNSEV